MARENILLFFETEKRISKGEKNSPFVISPLCVLKKKKEFQKKGEKNSPFVISPFCLPNNASVVLQKEKRNLEKEKKMTPQSHRIYIRRLKNSSYRWCFLNVLKTYLKR